MYSVYKLTIRIFFKNAQLEFFMKFSKLNRKTRKIEKEFHKEVKFEILFFYKYFFGFFLFKKI